MDNKAIVEAINANAESIDAVRDELKTLIAVSEDSKVVHRVADNLMSLVDELQSLRDLKIIELGLNHDVTDSESRSNVGWLRMMLGWVHDKYHTR